MRRLARRGGGIFELYGCLRERGEEGGRIRLIGYLGCEGGRESEGERRGEVDEVIDTLIGR